MKYLKTYENEIKKKPQRGDYVICKETTSEEPELKSFLSNNIGKIAAFFSLSADYFKVEYENVPDNIQHKFHFPDLKPCRNMFREEIIYWSKNKEDLEIYLAANKYNL